MRLFTTLLELAGMALLVAGAYLLAIWLGLIVAGVCLLIVGVVVGDGLPDPKPVRRSQ